MIKIPNENDLGEERFILATSEDSVHNQLALRENCHGGRVWQSKAVQYIQPGSKERGKGKEGGKD